MLESYPDVLTPKETAEILNVSPNHIYVSMRNGTIKSFRLGGAIRIAKKDLIELIEKKRN